MIINSKEIIQTKEVPAYNETGFIETGFLDSTQPFSYVKMVELIRKTPEAIGILKAIQTDVCSDGYTFEGPKNRVEEAKKFAKKNGFRTEFAAFVFDTLFLGNGALWKAKIEKTKVKEILKKMQSVMGIEVKETEIKDMLEDEDVYRTKLLRHAAWSTMHIDLTRDKKSIRRFRQVVGDSSRSITFQPEEIIHAKYMNFDGRVYGFAPMEASVNVLTTLSLIKDLNGHFFQNGGVPDWMFILPKEMAGSPNVKKLEQVLKKYKNSRNKHGNLVFTGEVETVALNKFDKDMEFRLLAIYYTGILALAYNMPMARVATILGAEVKSGGAATDLSEAGYWKSISSFQDYLEDLLNTQLWEPEFGVTWKLNRGYRNDEIKEAQRDTQMFDVLNKLSLAEAIKPEYIKQQLHIPDKYWTGKFKPIEESKGFGDEMAGSPGSSPKNDQKGTARQESGKRKKEEATKAMERKEVENGIMDVDLLTFMDLFNRWVKSSTTRKVNHYMDGDNFHFLINLPDEKYRLVIGKSQMDEFSLSELLTFGMKIKR